MHRIRKPLLAACAAAAAGTALAAGFAGVPHANPKAPGLSAPNVLTPELVEVIVAQGSTRLENPAALDFGGGATSVITNYGYYGDGPFLPSPGDVRSAPHDVEATKSEPDKNWSWSRRPAQPPRSNACDEELATTIPSHRARHLAAPGL